ncbi:MAG: 4-carboxy-4-hydroxy-2-oxoadipate aldolase/oxaloacetate decarboxylase [Synergistaceae bacterium]|nr:4-carboxy-4-hydroxy-2-oxoadipate aldolase/oxaloacetate decarboxylase [Synergistaceae bacterium]MBQ7169351.1 4-carboxy-4-hydroxy-2-oxoadipate aldolase/oxaloacetate decarboxylase [Synergistaceae bacterium]
MELTAEKLAQLSQLPTGNIADNNNHSPRQGVMHSSIKPIDPASHVLGRAVTARCYPGDNLVLHQAMYAAKPGDVLVLDCHGYTEAGHFGDIMALACKIRGIAGVILDGSCRDSQDIKAMGFPMFVKAFNPSGTVKKSLGEINVPVICGGVEVRPGDIVAGDCDGVVVVPREFEDEVFAAALAKFEKEAHIVEQLKAGMTTLEIYGFNELIGRLKNI